MATINSELSTQTLDFSKELDIAAPIEIAFEAVLAELGPESEMPGGQPFPMKVEAWPGGRWYRDLGNEHGHLWGHVQVIKPPTLLEISGPLFVSYPAMNHVTYRLTAAGDGGGTRLTITHRALGWMPKEFMKRVEEGWSYGLNRIREIAERRRGGKQK